MRALLSRPALDKEARHNHSQWSGLVVRQVPRQKRRSCTSNGQALRAHLSDASTHSLVTPASLDSSHADGAAVSVSAICLHALLRLAASNLHVVPMIDCGGCCAGSPGLCASAISSCSCSQLPSRSCRVEKLHWLPQ